MTKEKVEVHLDGRIIESMKESGKTASNMELVFLLLRMGSLRRESGKMERKFAG